MAGGDLIDLSGIDANATAGGNQGRKRSLAGDTVAGSLPTTTAPPA